MRAGTAIWIAAACLAGMVASLSRSLPSSSPSDPTHQIRQLTSGERFRQQELLAPVIALYRADDLVGRPVEQFAELLELADETGMGSEGRYYFFGDRDAAEEGEPGHFCIAVRSDAGCMKIVAVEEIYYFN